jgi:polyisoprenoid-binding protein YceI
MKNTKLTILALALAPALVGWTIASYNPVLQPGSRLWVTGTSTVRDFQCQARAVDAALETSTPQAARDIMAGTKAVVSMGVKVRAADLDCANNTMNEHMRKAIKAEANPVIDFTMTSYEIARGTDAMTGKLTGTLTLGGVEKQITIDAVGQATADGALHVTGAYPILMTDYGLKAPSLMMGAMKVNPKVTVNFDLLVK